MLWVVTYSRAELQLLSSQSPPLLAFGSPQTGPHVQLYTCQPSSPPGITNSFSPAATTSGCCPLSRGSFKGVPIRCCGRGKLEDKLCLLMWASALTQSGCSPAALQRTRQRTPMNAPAAMSLHGRRPFPYCQQAWRSVSGTQTTWQLRNGFPRALNPPTFPPPFPLHALAGTITIWQTFPQQHLVSVSMATGRPEGALSPASLQRTKLGCSYVSSLWKQRQLDQEKMG